MIKMIDFFKSKHRLMISTGVLFIIFFSGVLLTSGSTYGALKKRTSNGSLSTLLQYKTAYVGNNSKVIHLINNLNYAEFKSATSLQTKKTPYGVTIDYNFNVPGKVPSKEEAAKAIRYNAIMMFCLIDNADIISFKLSGLLSITYQFKREALQQFFLKDIRGYSKDLKSLTILSNSIHFTIFTAPEKYSPFMSSTPGIQISLNPVKDSVVKYTTNKGTFLTWNQQTGKITNYGKSATLHNPTYAYWSPMNNTSIGKGKTYVDIEISDTHGKLLIEKRLQISGTDEYTMVSRLDSVLNKNTKIDSDKVNAFKNTLDNNTATNTKHKKLTINDAAKLIGLSFVSSTSINASAGVGAKASISNTVSAPVDKLKEITYDDFWGNLKAQVFKFQVSKDSIANSYFIKDNKVLDLGYNSGTFDTKDICVTDLDKDGKKELLYYSNWGSGINYSIFHCYVDGCQLKSNFGSTKFCGFTFIKKDLQNVELGVWYPDLTKSDKSSTPIGKLYIKNNELCIKLYDDPKLNLQDYISIK